MHTREGSDSSSPPAGPHIPGPLVICSVAGPARETLITKLMQDYPSKFGTAIRQVCNCVTIVVLHLPQTGDTQYGLYLP